MTFADLHQGDLPLLLPNAWDATTAWAFADAGFPAVGTTSLGVAASLGLPDGGRATKQANRVLAQRLTSLPVPVSLDIEDGYDEDPDEVAAYVASVPCAGVNLEDSTWENLVPPERHAAKIAAVKARAPEVFVNARIDNFWFNQEATVSSVIERAAAYVEAGADGVFVPGVTDLDVIGELAAGVSVPLNVLLIPGVSLRELAGLGVRRVSTGSAPYRAALHAAVATATSARDDVPLPPSVTYADVQAVLHRIGDRPEA
jgi:2-methylisocitrate lyase-like PEP mutase family enzyme